MDMSKEQRISSHEMSVRCPTCNQFPIIKNKNKEKYHLYRENFSLENDINFEGIYKHIHYKFKNKYLLLDALHPLLPITLQRPEKKYNQLEFLGDSVLGLLIRERILKLFPDEERGVHVKLYEALTCNKTLADAYLYNLEIEPYLPYPNIEACEYCNVVEAVIGAIFNDAEVNEKGMTEARKFTLLILNEHILLNQIKKIAKEKNIELGDPIFPHLSSTIDDLFLNPKFNNSDSKSLLGMILGKTLEDQPHYITSIGKYNESPIFIVNVTASQIGNKIIGKGYTQYQAEQNAAREAINFLAKKECIANNEESTQPLNYKNFIFEYCKYKKMEINEKNDAFINNSPEHNFKFKVKIEDEPIGEGIGSTIKEAKEKAAHNAINFLVKNEKIDQNTLTGKGYQSMLKNIDDRKCLNKIIYESIPMESSKAITTFHSQISIGEDIFGKGVGLTKKKATENAYYSVFEELLNKQEQDSQARESRKLSAKIPNGSSIANVNSNRAPLANQLTHKILPQTGKNNVIEKSKPAQPAQKNKTSKFSSLNKKNEHLIPQIEEVKLRPSQKQKTSPKTSIKQVKLKSNPSTREEKDSRYQSKIADFSDVIKI